MSKHDAREPEAMWSGDCLVIVMGKKKKKKKLEKSDRKKYVVYKFKYSGHVYISKASDLLQYWVNCYKISTNSSIVSCPDPTLKEGKGVW